MSWGKVFIYWKCRLQSKMCSMILCFKYITHISVGICVASGKKIHQHVNSVLARWCDYMWFYLCLCFLIFLQVYIINIHFSCNLKKWYLKINSVSGMPRRGYGKWEENKWAILKNSYCSEPGILALKPTQPCKSDPSNWGSKTNHLWLVWKVDMMPSWHLCYKFS